MDKTELAAHLFRITQTEARIKGSDIRGRQLLQHAAHAVGAQVRDLVIENTGKTPESLPTAEPINKVKTKIKGTGRNLGRIDEKNTTRQNN